MSDEDKERARQQAKAQYDSIAEMVAALELDWERLEELREERADLQDAVFDALDDFNIALEDCYDQVHIDARCEALEEAEDNLYHWTEREELADLEEEAEGYDDQEDAERAIQEDPLTVEVRSCWDSPGGEMEACEFRILLCTGGPAVQIRGELGMHNKPSRAWLEYQDWFIPWTEFYDEDIDRDVLLTYCRQFYFGLWRVR